MKNNIYPIIFKVSSSGAKIFFRRFKNVQVIDKYLEQLEDLFLIRNPKFKFNKNDNYNLKLKKFIQRHLKNKELTAVGRWIYFPWDNTLVHFLDEKLHQEIRTARNKNLITNEEQRKFYNSKIGIAGLSVGSHAALTIALMGGGKLMKLADPDTVAPSNLNRIKFSFNDIGINKAILVAQSIWKLNPYSKIEIYPEGINEKNLLNFLKDLDILIEELDDVALKYKIRKIAKKMRIPVIMATDNGDNVIMDIERYDLNSNYPIFHGNLTEKDIKNINSRETLYKAMAKIININLVPYRVLKSVQEVGKTLYSWPQLATAASLSGAITAYVVREIILGRKIQSGKYEINIEKIFNPEYKKIKLKQIREIKRFKKILGL